jgi:hypothetical protein
MAVGRPAGAEGSPQGLVFGDYVENLGSEPERGGIRLDTGNIDIARLVGQSHMRRIVDVLPRRA